jgi:lipopolysaccharide/colanic/teichoic acid biosynthesis glycosyltransferase
MSSAWAIILLVGAVLCALAVAVAHSLLADEVRAWLPYLARRLVRWAARRLPADYQARYEADWLAELVAWEDRPMSALAKAAHIRWKVRAIRESLGGIQVKGEAAKRVFDLLFATGSLVLLSPTLLVAAIAIKLESRGPIFFFQPRAGRGDRSFRLIKFRSMYVDAEVRINQLGEVKDAEDQVVFRIPRDPRVTRVGGLLRRTSLDELPQLLNVIKGDMSLVGPRPLLPGEAAASKGEVESARIDVRPGLTGPGQIDDLVRGHQALRAGSRMDEEYARSRSLLLDFKLLMKTVLAVVIGGGRKH